MNKCQGKTDTEILKLKFADIACGSGAFLLELFQLLNDILIDYYLKANRTMLIQTNINTYKLPFKIKRELLLNCIYGIDKDYNAVEAAKFGLLLKLLEDENTSSTSTSKPVLPELKNNIFFGNSLLNPTQVNNKKDLIIINPFDFSNLKFDVIVGNPPYMKSEDMKNITPLELPLYKANYNSAYKQFDKYFLFLEQGINLLNDDGVLGYIVPSKFTKVGAGKKLREVLSTKGHLHTIVSFGANQVFAAKTTYTCLLILNKNQQKTFQYAEIENLKNWKVREPEAIKYASKNTVELNSDAWVLVPPELINTYNKIVAQSSNLIDLVGNNNIFNGIQTSANDIYIFIPIKEDLKYYYFSKKKINYQIEKAITKPYFQTSSGNDNLNTYRTFKPNARVIYPYQNTIKGVEIITLNDIQKEYKFAFDYLQKHKTILNNPKRDIKPEPATADEWHRFGRQQGLNISDKKEKIILGVLSSGDKYAIDKYGTLFTSGGTAGYCAITIPDNLDYSPYYIQAILNSKYVEWFVILTGEIFRGSYFARGTKVLNNLPIRNIDFSNTKEKDIHDKIVKSQKELIIIHDQIDLNTGNKRTLPLLQGQFEREKMNLEKLLAKLYNLGNDDLLIPLIKDLYETN